MKLSAKLWMLGLGLTMANAALADGAFSPATASLTVQANIQPACRLVSQTNVLDFGSFPALNAIGAQINNPTPASFTMTCTPGLNVTMTANGGNNALNGQRRMKQTNGQYYVNYSVSTDAAGTIPLPNQGVTTSAPVDTTPGSTSNGMVTQNLYVQLPVQPLYGGGGYADTMTITLAY